MKDALLLDTHMALWLASGNERLRRKTRERIDARAFVGVICAPAGDGV